MVEEIVKLVPEFKDYQDFTVFDINDNEEKRFLLGVFGRFMKERVENCPDTDPVIQRVYKFLNEQFNDPRIDKEARDLLIIDIFENLSPYEKGMEVSRKLLTGKALEAFNVTAEYF
ncbi:MAG: hypothetical protein HY564_02645 [Candidatus Jacksonbacteria bacterium]|nr:hypothetical protein [Candidatus Jacksonbacteria bacterium]